VDRENIRIGVVEDDAATRYVKSRVLRQRGYEIYEAGSGRDALDLAERRSPHLILLDVRLPDVSGIEICRQIKSRFPQIIILQTSAIFTGTADRVRALDGGADTYLVEPIESDELVATVEALLRMRRAEQEAQRINENLDRLVADRTRELLEARERLARETDDRRKAEVALWHTQKLDLIGQLTGGIAHDFNNLLTVIAGNLELVRNSIKMHKNSLPEGAKVLQWLANTEDAAGHAAKITQQLLAFARRSSLTLETLHVGDFLISIEGFLRRAAGEAVTLTLDCPQDLWPCRTDRLMLEAAVLNLVVNARDAQPDGGTVRIAVRNATIKDGSAATGIPDGEYARITVADFGCGMEPDVVERAFEPFFTTKEAGKGSGLGLSQVYGFTRQSGGQVQIESTPGVGTTVALYLPRATGASLRTELGEAQPEHHDLRGAETVLIVEDNELVRNTMKTITEGLGYRVLTVAAAVEALELIGGDAAVDILVSDIAMPGGVNGIELAARVRTLRPELPILLMSGYPAAIADDVGYPTLHKPFRSDELARQLRACFNGRTAPPLTR
jgi:signal transduction histidine kinase